jgi:hypothetical protein
MLFGAKTFDISSTVVPLSVSIFCAEPRQKRIFTAIGARGDIIIIIIIIIIYIIIKKNNNCTQAFAFILSLLLPLKLIYFNLTPKKYLLV